MPDKLAKVNGGQDLPMRPEDVVNQVALIQEVQKSVMKKDEHYGVIPGTGNKASLFKAGAEKLILTFRLAPEFKVDVTDMGNGHREYSVTTRIVSINTGNFLGSGVGSASTMESKYRYRKATQLCPECGNEEAIIKGKKQYGGGWLCYAKKGGCGAKFEDGDERIENQNLGRVEYPDPADYYNTCLKMSKKRSLVDAVLTVTAASDIFTQDTEDLPKYTHPEPGETRTVEPAPEGGASDDKGKSESQPSKPTGVIPAPVTTTGTTEPSEFERDVTPEPEFPDRTDLAQLVKVVIERVKYGWSVPKLEEKYGVKESWDMAVCKEIGEALRTLKNATDIDEFLVPAIDHDARNGAKIEDFKETEEGSKAALIDTCTMLAAKVRALGGAETLEELGYAATDKGLGRMNMSDLTELSDSLRGWLGEGE